MTDITRPIQGQDQDWARLRRTLILAVFGALGAASFYFTTFPVPEEYKDLISEEGMRIRALIGPMVMVGIALLLGHFFAPKAGVRAPLLDALFNGGSKAGLLKSQAKGALACALLYGAVIALPGYFIEASLAPEVAQSFQAFDQNIHVLTKVFWGSLSEEIVWRWGVLALILWGAQKCSRRSDGKTAMWVALIIGAAFTTVIHAPTVYQAVQDPPFALVALVIGGNFASAMLAGYLTLQRGLEAGMMFKAMVLASALGLSAFFA